MWSLQRAFFERHGVGAWSRGIVPHYVTTNPFIARAYARMVAAYLQDRGTGDPAREHVHLVEIGGGSGRFAYLLLRQLLPLLGSRRITYVLTDFAESVVGALERHPQLAAYVRDGVLDFARYDTAEPDAPLRLRVSGREVDDVAVVIANYVFDSIPHDVFTREGGRLYEGHVALCSTQFEPDPTDPAILARARFLHRLVPAGPRPYGDPELDALLDAWREGPAASLRFPVAALRVCRSFRARGGRFLLLSGDKGDTRDAGGAAAPTAFAVHGSVSVSVSYPRIVEWFRAAGGQAFVPPHQHGSIAVVAGVCGPGPHPATARAWEEEVEGFGPDDYFSLKGAIDGAAEGTTLDALLAWLRLGRGDARALQACVPALRALAPTAAPRHREDLVRLVDAAWANYFHLGEPNDLAFELGGLLAELGEHDAALRYFERSAALHGEQPLTLCRMFLCLLQAGRTEEALAVARRVLAIAPEHEAVGALRRLLERA